MSNTAAKKPSNLPIRIAFYIFGFLIMTLGIAISVKSNLGVSPVSSIPYTMTCIIGLEMGLATIVFHIALVLIQILLLRKNFELKNLLQVPVGVLFGFFTTFCNGLMDFFPDPTSITIRILMMLASAFFIAFGVFLYVPADLVPLAGEGTMLAVSKVTKIKFSTVKLGFDISMVAISLITCLICLHKSGSVGIGTIIAAVLVGTLLKLITRVGGSTRDRLLKKDYTSETAGAASAAAALNPVMAEIMKTDVYTVTPDMNVREALQFLRDKKISGAPIVDPDLTLCGFISDGDILRFLAGDYSLFVSKDNSSDPDLNKKMQELMNRKVMDIATRHCATVSETSSIEEVCGILKERGMKKIPVTRNGKLIGVVNRSTIVHYTLRMMNQ